MSRPRVVVDNSAILPSYFPEHNDQNFDAGLVTNRSRSLVQAIRLDRVQAFAPPSFYREFLNVATFALFQPGGRSLTSVEKVRAQWHDLLALPLLQIPLNAIVGLSGELVFSDGCPASDSWYVAAAMQADATFWMSHDHSDGLFDIASRHVDARLLSRDTPNY